MKMNPPSGPKKTNPIQTQFLQRPKSLARKSGHTHFKNQKKILDNLEKSDYNYGFG